MGVAHLGEDSVLSVWCKIYCASSFKIDDFVRDYGFQLGWWSRELQDSGGKGVGDGAANPLGSGRRH